MNGKLCALAISLLMVGAIPAFAETRSPVNISSDVTLPLRVLARPHAVLFGDESEAKPVDSNVPVFKSYYVYTRPGGEARETGIGWYEVGTDEKGTIAGWMRSSDVFEWKQTMCLAYAHPKNRSPVLMFEDKESLDGLIKADVDKRVQDVKALYESVNNAATTPLASDFPVLSVEPKMAVDGIKQFYLLPILEHEEMTINNYEGRLLRLAAVSGKADAPRDKASDIRKNAEYAQAATADNGSQTERAKAITVDVVWVMDTTRSMQPYIEAVRNTMTTISQQVAAIESLKDSVSFGLWAYRDSVSIEGIEYNTKNITPELLQIDAFTEAIKEAKETKADSVDVAEDMFGGVHKAITETKWRPNSIRIVVLVGDAPSHGLGHKWNTTQMDENTVRALATGAKITIFSLHVTPSINKKYNSLATKQFSGLAMNPGTTKSMYWALEAKNREEFSLHAKKMSDMFVTMLAEAQKGTWVATAEQAETSVAEAKEQGANAKPVTPAAPASLEERLEQMEVDVRQALQAATVTWLGREANVEPPRDIEAWVADKDLLDPATQALEVRLLISKRQLDSLAVMLNNIVEAGRKSQTLSDDFFTSLQSVSAAVALDGDKIGKSNTLAETGLVPAFLMGLPYKSQVMNMSSELWSSWSPDEQDSFVQTLVSKVEAYKSLHNSPDNWVTLNSTDTADDHVTPILLDLLP